MPRARESEKKLFEIILDQIHLEYLRLRIVSHNLIRDIKKGALKQGPCDGSTFKVFNLTYLHVLRS